MDRRFVLIVVASVLVGGVQVPGPGRASPVGSSSAQEASTSTLADAVEHRRVISLSLDKHLIATGRIRVPDGYSQCAAKVDVIIQRRDRDGSPDEWRWVRHRFSDADGYFEAFLKKDIPSDYRAIAPRGEFYGAPHHKCRFAASRVKTHEH